MSETLEQAAEAARQAIEKLNALGETWRAQADRQSIELTRQREEPRDILIGSQRIDGQSIEYWHSIATSTLKTNNELIDRVKELKSTNEALVKCHQDQADSYTKRTDELIETRRRERVLLDQLREKECINAGLEHKLQAAVKTASHQQRCAEVAENERDAALRELDAMREKMKPKNKAPEPRTYLVSVNGGPPAKVTRDAFYAMRDSAPVNGDTWGIREERDNVSELYIGS